MKQEQVLQAIEEQKKQVTEAYNAADKSTLKPSTVKQMDSMLTKVTELPAHVSAEYKAQKEAEAKQAIIDCDTAVAK